MTAYTCQKPDPAHDLQSWDGDVENIEPCFVVLSRINSTSNGGSGKPIQDGPVQTIAYWRPHLNYVTRTSDKAIVLWESKYHLPYWWRDRIRHRAVGPALLSKSQLQFYVDGFSTFKVSNLTGDVWMPRASTVARRPK